MVFGVCSNQKRFSVLDQSFYKEVYDTDIQKFTLIYKIAGKSHKIVRIMSDQPYQLYN